MKEIAIGIDIGGTNTVIAAVDITGELLAERVIRTDKYEMVEEYVDNIAETIENLLTVLGENTSLIGIGIGAPNVNSYTGTIEFAPNLKWKGNIKLDVLISKYFNVPVYLLNDANAAALGEMMYGAAKGMRDFIVVTLGTGLGSGFVSNGELIVGHNGHAGELGHTIVRPNGRPCGCGRNGCLEQYASATGIVKTVKDMLKNESYDSILRSYKDFEITSKLIYQAAQQGDALSIQAFEFTGKILGLALANAVAIVDPEVIILAGGLSFAGEFLLKPTRKSFEENLMHNYKNKVRVILSKILAGNPAVLGASAIVWKNL
ncbi:MAG: ROK family protein [Ignavibacteria bacterium]